MNPIDELERQIASFRVTTTDLLDRRILTDASASLKHPPPMPKTKPLDAHRSSVWKTVTSNTWTKLAAALCIAAILGTITFLQHTTSVTYALEQTLEANKGLRYIHVRVDPAERFSEAWAEFGEDGELLRLRMIFPSTEEDGAAEILWHEDKVEYWMKSEGQVHIIRKVEMFKHYPETAAKFDPRLAMKQLHEAEANGKVGIETKDPSSEGEPITLVAKFVDSPDKRVIYQINSRTKLVERIERYRLAGDERELVACAEYLEYNQKAPPEVFTLDIPPNVMRIDMQNVGLSKGNLTDDQIAVKVAREFFRALIEKDYGRASGIFAGVSVARLEQAFGNMEFVRIISVGEPAPHPDTKTKFLQVPCEVEVRVDGELRVKKFTPNIQAVGNRPDRWAIWGGI